MKFKKSATTLAALIALASANIAFAEVLCGPPNNLGGGDVSMSVTITSGLEEDATYVVSGSVTADIGTCIANAGSCLVTATGTPGSGPQTVTFSFLEAGAGAPVECLIDNDDGLPVELNKFSVE